MQQKVQVKKNEEKIIPYIWINGKELETCVDISLVEKGAAVHIIGLFIGTNGTHCIFNTNVVHKAPQTKSRTTLRGVFFKTSSFSNDGLILIKKGAKGADGFFSSKILLFDDAKGKSVPSLEIDENEVKAGHASTVGRPNQAELFYLKSRGLSEKDAEKLIISGFFQPILRLLPKNKQENIQKEIVKVL